MVSKKRKAGIPFGLITTAVLFGLIIFNFAIVLYLSQSRIDATYVNALEDELEGYMQQLTTVDAVKTLSETSTQGLPYTYEVIDAENRSVIFTNSISRQDGKLSDGWSIQDYFDGLLSERSLVIFREGNKDYNSMNKLAFGLPSSLIGLSKLDGNYYLIVQSEIVSTVFAVDIIHRALYSSLIVMLIISLIIAFLVSQFYSAYNKKIIEAADKIAERNYVQLRPVSVKEINQLANSLNHVSKEMKSYDESQKTFISDASHELKTPLSIISSYVEGIKYGLAKTEEDNQAYCDIILDECNRMNSIISDMISLVKAGMIYSENTKDDIDIVEFIDAEIDRNKERFSSANITANIYASKENMLIHANVEDFSKIISNFISNAYKYCTKDGEVVISCKEENDYIILSIYNDCIPLKEEDLNHIWDRFYKSDRARSRNESSTGIGLSIVKAILDKNNYPYGVSNVKGGIEFWVAFPNSHIN